MCPHCRAFITNKDRVCPYCNETVGPRAADQRNPAALLGGLIPPGRFNIIAILLVNVGLYLATTIYSMRSGNSEGFMNIDGRTLLAFGAKYPPLIAAGQWWRLVTAGFLHGGLFHIFMNSYVLFDVGWQVEEVYGASRMWVIYFIASTFGFYVSSVWSSALSVGASAGLMGLIGAMIVMGMRHRSALGDAVRGHYVRWVIWILVIGLLPGLHVDNAAHVGGLAGGFGVAWLAGQPRLGDSLRERLWRAASWFCILLTVVSFLKWYLWFSQATQ